MSIVLDSQTQIRELRNLPFCYLCGINFKENEQPNPDHVPPKKLFAIEDRDFPLILPTHRCCNSQQSQDDQVICQLVGLIYGRPYDQNHNKLRVEQWDSEGKLYSTAGGFSLRSIIKRWICGFHTALYKEYLSEELIIKIFPPFPEARQIEKGKSIATVTLEEVYEKFADVIKTNRLTKTIDSVITRKGKCRYECVWTQADNREWVCIFYLNIYNWRKLGDIRFQTRDCIGLYRRSYNGHPDNASCATRISIPPINLRNLDL